MGNKKDLIWYCVIFTSPEKNEIFKTLKCDTIKEMGYYLDISPQTIRNYYHKNKGCLHNQLLPHFLQLLYDSL